jgi:nitrogen fixation protein NifQ
VLPNLSQECKSAIVRRDEIYAFLMGGATAGGCDAFDAHVMASVMSLAMVEAESAGRSPVIPLGLDAAVLIALVDELFPRARAWVERLDPTERFSPDPEEARLRELLERSATVGTPFEANMAAVIARRAQRPNHLWQDLGLRHRRELNWLMGRHFETLAARNSRDMKWKKFLYRQICVDDALPICPAPTCDECCDYQACFGGEEGPAPG